MMDMESISDNRRFARNLSGSERWSSPQLIAAISRGMETILPFLEEKVDERRPFVDMKIARQAGDVVGSFLIVNTQLVLLSTTTKHDPRRIWNFSTASTSRNRYHQR